jgi:hypothetical protein
MNRRKDSIITYWDLIWNLTHDISVGTTYDGTHYIIYSDKDLIFISCWVKVESSNI